MTYSVPGFADQVSPAVVAAWNARVERAFDSQGRRVDPDFLKRDPSDIPNSRSTDRVRWRGSPAEPEFCLGRAWAEKLSNWGLIGRHELHNEYLEFGLIMRPDAQGRLRPKRFAATTELREYWLTLAVTDPNALRTAAQDVLGRAPEWREFYGEGVTDPTQLSESARERLFIKYVAGSGFDDPGPDQPEGGLNRENVLFMSHPINGLDDLVYVVAFGAHPYVVREGAGTRRATLHEIFIAGWPTGQSAEHLACRNADPAACAGAFDQVYKHQAGPPTGTQVAFTDPLGMYIRSFRTAGLLFNNAPVPGSWERRWRGTAGFEQRLEFGPRDDEPGFLDEVTIDEGEEPRPLIPGYELARRIEVGPEVTIGEDAPIPAAKFIEIPAATRVLDCSQARVCGRMSSLKQQYEAQSTSGVRGGF